jgi:hypothetical protein
MFLWPFTVLVKVVIYSFIDVDCSRHAAFPLFICKFVVYRLSVW